MKNLKLLIIILIMFAIGLAGVIVIIGMQSDENQVNSNEQTYNISNITQNENILNQTDNNVDVGNIEITDDENDNSEEYINYVEQMESYLADYSFQIFNDIEKAYNLLDEEYRSKRFSNIELFQQYITNKQGQLSNIEIRQYNVEEEGEYTIYKGTDENGNYYCIKANSNMEYTIILDSYTMQADYSDESTEEKVEKNTEKFILMINSADYTNAYNLLEPTFKATYFPTEQDFINYIKNNWFERNIIASKEVTEEGICVVMMRETISTRANKIEKQFKVTLGDGMAFTIEFNI